jgi:hypothetical protein
MKAGRNDPCPCGSGKKYKKCCWAKDQAGTGRPADVFPPASSPDAPHPARFLAPRPAAVPSPPPPPPDPITERGNLRWEEFESKEGEDRIVVFLDTLEDAEVMTDDLAFEMLERLHADAVESGSRTRFAECVAALRERRPEVFDEGAHYYLSWCVVDALAENRQELVPSLMRELAGRAGRDIDTFNRTVDALEYHGQLSVLVEALRLAWPAVKTSENIVPWGVTEFAQKGAEYEIYDYLEHTAAPDPADPALLDRIRFFVGEPRTQYVRELIVDLTGNSGREWHTDDFVRRPPEDRSRDEWDDEEEEWDEDGERDEEQDEEGDAEEPEREPPDPGARNLSRLLDEFVGCLRREDGVPFTRGELATAELRRYFDRRHEGDLDPRPSLWEKPRNPARKPPAPPRPIHPLCPDRATLDVHLGGLLDVLNGLYYAATAVFQAVPAWLQFLESRRLIDASTHKKVAEDLRPLHASLLKFWENYADDPTLLRLGQTWPLGAASAPPNPPDDPGPPKRPPAVPEG